MSNYLITLEMLETATIIEASFPESDEMGNDLGTVLGQLDGSWVVWDQSHGDACIEDYSDEAYARSDYDDRVQSRIDATVARWNESVVTSTKTTTEIVEALNAYTGDDFWGDILYPVADFEATEAADSGSQTVVVLDNGDTIRYAEDAQSWMAANA